MRPRPRVAVVLAAVGAAALLLPWQLAAVVAGALLVATVVDALVARAAREPVMRETPTSVARGTPFAIHVAARPGLPTAVKQPQTAELRVENRVGCEAIDATGVALRRGRHTLPAPVTRVAGPLGLAEWGGAAGEPVEVAVYPDLPGARRLARAARGGRLRPEGRRRGPLGIGTEFESVRDYQDDDDVRRINWRATQRLGRPMTNQFRVERDRDVVCVIDCGRLVAAPLGDSTRLDVAVDAALAVAAVADELGDRCGVIAFDSELRRVVAPRRRGARDVLVAVHDLEPRPVESDYARAFAEVGAAKRAFVLVLTDVVEESAAQPLERALPMLARRHAVTVGSVADPDLAAALTSRPGSAAAVYRQVAALDVDEARARAVARLRRAGADVVEASPAGFAVACVRSYLRAKALARL